MAFYSETDREKMWWKNEHRSKKHRIYIIEALYAPTAYNYFIVAAHMCGHSVGTSSICFPLFFVANVFLTIIKR